MVIKDEEQPLHILFFPFLAPGHLIPIADMAVLFATRGVKCAILTTPVNAQVIRSAVDRANDSSRGTEGALAIDIAVVPFPGVECAPALNSAADRKKFFHGARLLLREPFDRFLVENRPDAVVTDSFFNWSADAAAEHGVPRIAFLGSSLFSRACSGTTVRNNPVEAAPDDPDALVLLPGLPHLVELRRSQMTEPKKRPEHWAFFQRMNAADQRSYGEVFNTFHELEPDYLEHYTTTLGRRVWLVGPVAFASKDAATRGDRGFIIRGWAPQMLILTHLAVGGFVTHCGWNSTLEAVSAGVPMVTWPRYADQFYNEKLVVELLKVGVGVGSADYASKLETRRVIGGELIAEVIGKVMGDGEEAEAIREKAQELGEKARRAVAKVGSSYDDVGRLVEELMARRSSVDV
ncbi:scopoletin glucosyltransferase-like [Miscanthus floridulus]|uniref:scopoletin glucosyltransferase-like n=1 Tax=Miscanthus floridulus TaxID=154761 RepID=UPI00345B40D6